jgi:hypothetical protein
MVIPVELLQVCPGLDCLSLSLKQNCSISKISTFFVQLDIFGENKNDVCLSVSYVGIY